MDYSICLQKALASYLSFKHEEIKVLGSRDLLNHQQGQSTNPGHLNSRAPSMPPPWGRKGNLILRSSSMRQLSHVMTCSDLGLWALGEGKRNFKGFLFYISLSKLLQHCFHLDQHVFIDHSHNVPTTPWGATRTWDHFKAWVLSSRSLCSVEDIRVIHTTTRDSRRPEYISESTLSFSGEYKGWVGLSS